MLDPERETFIQEYRKHGNATEAFRKAKPRSLNWKSKTVNERASRMLAEDKVQARLSDLQARSAEKHDITIDKLTQMTLDAYEMAMRDNVAAPSAAVKASEFLGKLHGLVVEKRELTGKDGAALVPVLNVTVAGD